MFFVLVSFADLLFAGCTVAVYTTSNGASSNNNTYSKYAGTQGVSAASTDNVIGST